MMAQSPAQPTTLSAFPVPLQFYDSLQRKVIPFQPGDPQQVSCYVCGPTVYDDAHLGHARCYITWDVFVRFLRFCGYTVTYARNITDVDDKILNKARAEGITPAALTARYIDRFHEDMKTLNVAPPDSEPRATAYIQPMQKAIAALMDKGFAYSVPDGTVYFKTANFPEYGQLSQKPLKDLITGARVETDPNKETPLDFALWKGVDPADPDKWPSPWGEGRPGWHIECSTMIQAVLGDQIDIHAGGVDLTFPHHENEIAQSQCWLDKKPFVRHWLHNGFVNVSGQKMSKSLGNFSTIRSLLEEFKPNTIRYFLLLQKYRMPVDFQVDALTAAQNRVSKLEKIFAEALAISTLSKDPITLGELLSRMCAERAVTTNVPGFFSQFILDMAYDLNTAKALTRFNEATQLLDKLVKQNVSAAALIPELENTLTYALAMWHHLGFLIEPISTLASAIQNQPRDSLHVSTPRKVKYCDITLLALPILQQTWQAIMASEFQEALMPQYIQLRQSAKVLKQWQLADEIRDHLKQHGVQLIDEKDGTCYQIET